MKDPDLDEFLAAMSDVKPLQNSVEKHQPLQKQKETEQQRLKREAAQQQAKKDANYLTLEAVEPVDPYDVLGYKKSGVQEGVYKKLRLGKYDISSTLNLRHCNLKQARELVFSTVQSALAKNTRLILIQHGIGLQSKPHPAVLKSYINNWLQAMPEVLAFHSAQKHHGGTGAVYLLLRKSEEKKQQNREIHAKR